MKYFIRKRRLNVHLVGVTSDPEKEVEKFLEKHALGQPVVWDERRKIHRRFRVDLVPYKVILKNKAVVYNDNYYQGFFERRREAERCLLNICRK